MVTTTLASTTRIRDLYLNVTSLEASDTLLNQYVDIAERVIRRDLATDVINGAMSGSIDGSNTTLTVGHYPIADVDNDGNVTSADVTVWGWTKADYQDTRVTLAISTVYPNLGQVILSSPISNTYECVTGDYSYYNQPVDQALVQDATELYAAYLYAYDQVSLVPPRIVLGGMRIDYVVGARGGGGTEFPHDRFLKRYRDIIKRIRTKSVSVTPFYESIEPKRRVLEDY